MNTRTLAGLAMLALSSAAWAFHCPADMKRIDDALAKNPKLSSAQMSEVKRLRAEGESLHKAGKHQESIDTLAKAQAILDQSGAAAPAPVPSTGSSSY